MPNMLIGCRAHSGVFFSEVMTARMTGSEAVEVTVATMTARKQQVWCEGDYIKLYVVHGRS